MHLLNKIDKYKLVMIVYTVGKVCTVIIENLSKLPPFRNVSLFSRYTLALFCMFSIVIFFTFLFNCILNYVSTLSHIYNLCNKRNATYQMLFSMQTFQIRTKLFFCLNNNFNLIK